MSFKQDLHDDRYGYPGSFPAFRCGSCAHVTIHVVQTPAEIESLYSDYYPRSSFDVEEWSPAVELKPLDAWWQGENAAAYRWVPRNVRVLDIGCGFGESLGYHRNRGCAAYGVEADINALRVAERHRLSIHHGLFDPGQYAREEFDVVTLDQVAEHVSDPIGVLRGVASVLKPGGFVVISTPNANGLGARLFGKRWIHWHAPYHQHFFSRKSFELAAKKAGLSVMVVRTITKSAWFGYQMAHLLSYPPRNEPSSFWSPGKRSKGLQRAVRRAVLIACDIGIGNLVTRLADSLQLGDNFLLLLHKPSEK